MLLTVIVGALVVNLAMMYTLRENKIDAGFLAICALFQIVGIIGIFLEKGSVGQKRALKASHVALVVALLLGPIVAQTNVLLAYVVFIIAMIVMTRLIAYSQGQEGCIFLEYEDYEDYKKTILQSIVESPLWKPFGGWIPFAILLTSLIVSVKLYYINKTK